MCKESEDSSSMQDVPLVDDDDNHDKVKKRSGSTTSESEEHSDPEEPIGYTDLCCRKHVAKVQSGKDLGVGEASLEDQANVFSKWMLSYLTPLLQLGSQKVLDQSDVGVASKEDLADRAYDVAAEAWKIQSAKTDEINRTLKEKYEAKLAKCSTEEERNKVKEPTYKQPSIAFALVKGFGAWRIIYAIFLYVISALLGFVPVLVLRDLVRYFESEDTGDDVFSGITNPRLEVAALGVIPFVISLLQTRHQTIMAHCAVFVRNAVSTLLYRKALRVSAPGRAKTSTGQVVNMMSNDTAQLQRFLQFGGMTLVAPIQIILALALIYREVSLPCALVYNT